VSPLLIPAIVLGRDLRTAIVLSCRFNGNASARPRPVAPRRHFDLIVGRAAFMYPTPE
jgi:hypothetical protein